MHKNALSGSCIDLNQLEGLKSSGVMKVEKCVATIETDGESIEVECNSLSEMHVKPDLIDIKYIIPALTQKEDDCAQDVKTEMNESDSFDNSEYFQIHSNQNEQIIEVIVKSEDAGGTNSDNDEHADSYVCYICSRCFNDKSALNRHMNLHLRQKSTWPRGGKKKSALPLKRVNEHLLRETAKDKRNPCDVCGKHFVQKAHLNAHMSVHTGEKPYKCDICDKGFNFKNNLQRHMLMHTGPVEKRFKCNICEKLFTRKEHLSKHIISHTNEMPHQCMLCNKLFKYKDSLRGHLKYHNGEKHFRCEICGNGFIRHDNLQVHLRTIHADEKSLHCDACNVTFTGRYSYEDHMKMHTGRTYYKCQTCGKLCKNKHNLRIHSNIHLVEKPYKCVICNHTFSQRGTLTYHMRTHTGEKPFTCFICERSFTQKATLRNHVQRHRMVSEMTVKDEPK